MLKWVRELSHEFGPQGATITPIGSGHYRLNLPNGRRVTLPGTPSDHRSIHNIRAKVRRYLRPVEAESNVVELAAPKLEVAIQPANVIIELQGIIEPPAPPKGEVVYHHTCTAHLPYILQDGELRPRGDDILWATTSPQGDRCSAIGYRRHREYFRDGLINAIRFTCNAEDFRSDWESAALHVEHSFWWTPDELKEGARREGQQTSCWRWRKDELPIDDTLIEMKTWNGRWQLVETFSLIALPNTRARAIRIGDIVYASKHYTHGWDPLPPMHIHDLKEAIEVVKVINEAARSDTGYALWA